MAPACIFAPGPRAVPGSQHVRLEQAGWNLASRALRTVVAAASRDGSRSVVHADAVSLVEMRPATPNDCEYALRTESCICRTPPRRPATVVYAGIAAGVIPDECVHVRLTEQELVYEGAHLGVNTGSG